MLPKVLVLVTWMLIQDPRLGWYNCADVRNVDDEYRIHRTLYNITASAVPVAVLSVVCSTGDRLGQTHWTNLNYNHSLQPQYAV